MIQLWIEHEYILELVLHMPNDQSLLLLSPSLLIFPVLFNIVWVNLRVQFFFPSQPNLRMQQSFGMIRLHGLVKRPERQTLKRWVMKATCCRREMI
jgi:hypothetical protein